MVPVQDTPKWCGAPDPVKQEAVLTSAIKNRALVAALRCSSKYEGSPQVPGPATLPHPGENYVNTRLQVVQQA